MKNLAQCGVFQLGEGIEWENVGTGIQRKVYGYNDQLMMVKIKFEKGAVGTLHQHHHTQVSYVESGEFELIIDNENKKLRQGDGYLVPSNIIHGLFCIEPGVLVEAFTPCREDFLKL
jgi:quercetin dioxygenase-like cupin family protein